MRTPPEPAIEARARRAAKRVGLIVRRSRRHDDNLGGFMLLDDRDRIVVGARFDLMPKAVIDLCTAAFNHGSD